MIIWIHIINVCVCVLSSHTPVILPVRPRDHGGATDLWRPGRREATRRP